jgi:hypothetical protein
MRHRRLRGRLGWRLLTITPLVVLILWPGALPAQVPYKANQRKALIATNIQQSLAPAQLGLKLLQTGSTPEDLTRASEALYSSYKHLRRAQEASQSLQAEYKHPDLLTKLRDARIQKIRDGLRYCRDNDGALINRDPQFTADCLRRLVDAVRLLEIVVMTDN